MERPRATSSGDLEVMDYFIKIKIGQRTKPGSPFPVNVLLPDSQEAKGWFQYEPPPKVKVSGLVYIPVLSPEIAGDLSSALFKEQVLEFVKAAIKKKEVIYYSNRVLVEILPEELFPLPWELILHYPPLNAVGKLQIIRFSPYLAELALIPMRLPIDVLVASLANPEKKPAFPYHLNKPLDPPLKYFQATISPEVTAHDVRNLLLRREFDIVHLQGYGFWRNDSQGLIGKLKSSDHFDALQLKTLLKRSHTRLLILEEYGKIHGPLLDLGHRILGRNGPAVLVVSSQNLATAPTTFFTELYSGFVHDKRLDEAVENARRRESPYSALLYARDSENLIFISQLGSRLLAHGRLELEFATEVKDNLSQLSQRLAGLTLQPELKEAFNVRHAVLDKTLSGLKKSCHIAHKYQHKSGGMVPLRKASDLINKAREALVEARQYADRVVNAWFSLHSKIVSSDISLRARRKYKFHLQIGARSQKSIVLGPKALPEEVLQRFYSDKGLGLRVVLFSDDFIIKRPDRLLRLPRPPKESKELKFTVIAPKKLGLACMRASIYRQQNLLQSLLVSATITKEKQSGLVLGNKAEVEFALSSSLRDIEHFAERDLNILTNERPEGTHAFAIVGSELKKQFYLTEEEMDTSIFKARQKLQEVCSTLDRNGKPKEYRFDDQNKGKEEQFISDLKKLADIGYNLYVGLCTNINDWNFEDRLKKILKQPGKIIQVSSTKSANYVFPWALVYDRDLHLSDKNVICSTFLDDLRRGGNYGFLMNQVCLTGGCPNENNKNVICPSGFWGYKHIIEQPLSTHQEENDDQPVRFDLCQSIEIDGRILLLMAVSENLRNLKEHREEMKALQNMEAVVHSSCQEIGKALQRQDLHVVYFYCHGGRTERGPYLGVGNKEKIYVADIKSWQVRWPLVHPFVFINGCHTVDLTPKDLLSFNKILAYCRAAGVIGTEIVIHETLARHFAKEFFKDFLNGQKVGKIMRHQRLLLLERYNPLGLVYTPYCSADLCLVQKRP